MANQIASFFRSYPDEEAAAGVHDHIVAFWSPAMRRDLRAYVDADGSGVDPLVERAMNRIGKGPSPTAREAAGPDVVGQLGASDAG
jgi:formate dehydrogenase subunit delta